MWVLLFAEGGGVNFFCCCFPLLLLLLFTLDLLLTCDVMNVAGVDWALNIKSKSDSLLKKHATLRSERTRKTEID